MSTYLGTIQVLGKSHGHVTTATRLPRFPSSHAKMRKPLHRLSALTIRNCYENMSLLSQHQYACILAVARGQRITTIATNFLFLLTQKPMHSFKDFFQEMLRNVFKMTHKAIPVPPPPSPQDEPFRVEGQPRYAFIRRHNSSKKDSWAKRHIAPRNKSNPSRSCQNSRCESTNPEGRHTSAPRRSDPVRSRGRRSKIADIYRCVDGSGTETWLMKKRFHVERRDTGKEISAPNQPETSERNRLRKRRERSDTSKSSTDHVRRVNGRSGHVEVRPRRIRSMSPSPDSPTRNHRDHSTKPTSGRQLQRSSGHQVDTHSRRPRKRHHSPLTVPTVQEPPASVDIDENEDESESYVDENDNSPLIPAVRQVPAPCKLQNSTHGVEQGAESSPENVEVVEVTYEEEPTGSHVFSPSTKSRAQSFSQTIKTPSKYLGQINLPLKQKATQPPGRWKSLYV